MGSSFSLASASPSECLAITGFGIQDVKLAKKAWIAPGQRCTRFDISPVNYTMDMAVPAMTTRKLPFILLVVFTVGPRVDDKECLLRYAKLISRHDKRSHVEDVIEGVIRLMVASMSIEEIYKDTMSFKQAVSAKVQLELNESGLIIYNVNVVVKEGGEEPLDVGGRGQKTSQEAEYHHLAGVVEERMKASPVSAPAPAQQPPRWAWLMRPLASCVGSFTADMIIDIIQG